MNARTAFLILGIAALAAFSASDVIARGWGLGREGLGMGKFGAAGSKGSNGTGPVSCAATGFRFLNSCNSQYTTVIHF